MKKLQALIAGAVVGERIFELIMTGVHLVDNWIAMELLGWLYSLTSTPSPSPTHNYIFSTAITQHPRSDKSSLVMLKNGTMALSREAENRRKALQSIDENDDEDTHFKRYVRCAGFFIVADMSLFIFEFWNLT